MPYYYVDQKLISNLINPYHLSEEKISKAEIEEVLEQGIFDQDNSLTSKEKLLKQVAFLIINENLLKTHIQFNEHSIFCADLYTLMASLYEEKEKILIYIDDKDIEKAIQILNINKEESFIKENVMTSEKSTFSWNTIEDLSQNTWSNESFILNKIKQNSPSKEILSYVDPLMWKDLEFMKKIWAVNEIFLHSLDEETMCSNTMLELVSFSLNKENPQKNFNLFIYIFDSYVRTLWHQDKKNYMTNSYKLNNLNHMNFKDKEEFNNMKELLTRLNKASVLFIERLTKEILIDKDLVKSLILLSTKKENKTVYLPSLYKLLPSHLKIDKEILKLYFEASFVVSMNLTSFIDPEAFKDEELLELFIKRGLFNLSGTDSYIYDHWITDKDKLLKYAKFTKNNITNRKERDRANDPFLAFITMIPKTMRKDEDVMEMFVSKNPKIYHSLSEEMRNKKRILFAYISDIKDLEITYNLEKIPNEVLLSLNTEELVFLLDKIPDLVFRNEDTKKWLENKDLVSSLGAILHKVSLSEKVKEEMFSSKEYTYKILKKEINNFSYIPEKYRKNINIASYYIKKCYYSDLKLIPKQLWSSIDFCINFIKVKKICSNEISPLLWNNKVFILELAKIIEDGTVDINLLNQGPKRINELINLYEIKKDTIYSFFNNYFTKIELENSLTNTTVTKKKNKI